MDRELFIYILFVFAQHWRQDVQLEPGHAGTAAGDPRAPAQAVQGGRNHLPHLPTGMIE